MAIRAEDNQIGKRIYFGKCRCWEELGNRFEMTYLNVLRIPTILAGVCETGHD
jgi:hypothetical protein